MTVRQIAIDCKLSEDYPAGYTSFMCGDETYLMPTGTAAEGCLCTMDYDDDTGVITASTECDQSFYTESALDDVCDYDPPLSGVGKETHIGTMSFREVLTVRVCYDPCGTIDVTINHKVYCQFGVRRENVPPPIVDPPVSDWVFHSLDLVLDATYTWTDVTCPNCEDLADLGPPTGYIEAEPYEKTWGASYLASTYCTTPSSFTVTIPGSCAATGLRLLGGGTPCDCP
jgi:hypothetical protein